MQGPRQHRNAWLTLRLRQKFLRNVSIMYLYSISPFLAFLFAIVKNYLNVNYKKHMAYCTNALLLRNNNFCTKVHIPKTRIICLHNNAITREIVLLFMCLKNLFNSNFVIQQIKTIVLPIKKGTSDQAGFQKVLWSSDSDEMRVLYLLLLFSLYQILSESAYHLLLFQG